MKTRVITAVCMLAVLAPVLIFSEYIIFSVTLGILAAMAVFEVLRVVGLIKNLWVAIPTVGFALMLPVFTHSRFFSVEESAGFIRLLFLSLVGLLFYLVFLSVFSKGKISSSQCGAVFMAVAYITVGFASLGLVRYGNLGVYTFVLIFMGAWVCDTFAYFCGMLFGKHKLIVELSPKKTVEGSIGGIAFTVLAFILYGVVCESLFSLSANYLVLAISGLVLSVISQLGDLFASLIKREYGVKDYSRLLPGHGGIMDRFDSIIAVSGAFMVICMIFPPFC